MKQFFKWKKIRSYGKRSPIFYKSDRKRVGIEHNKMFIMAEVQTRINGPNTAWGRIYLTVEWPTFDEQKWGWQLYRHESGHNASHKIRAWCNYLLNYFPYGISKIEGAVKWEEE